MSIEKLRADLVDLTPDLCRRFSTMKRLQGERDLKESHLDFLGKHLTAGTFYSPTWSVVTLKGSSDELRCDGQHSSTMLARVADSATPERFPEGMNVLIIRYQIDSIEADAAVLFNYFDNPKSTRTNTDVMSIFRAHHDQLKDLDNGFLVKISGGIHYLLSENERQLLKEYEKVKARAIKRGGPPPKRPALPRLFDARQRGLYWEEQRYRNFAVWMNQWRDAPLAWIMDKPGVVAQILDCWLTVPQRAQTYWDFVFRENHAEPEHSSRRLIKKLESLAKKAPRPKAADYRSCAEELWATYLHKEPTEEPLEPEPLQLSLQPPQPSVIPEQPAA